MSSPEAIGKFCRPTRLSGVRYQLSLSKVYNTVPLFDSSESHTVQYNRLLFLSTFYGVNDAELRWDQITTPTAKSRCIFHSMQQMDDLIRQLQIHSPLVFFHSLPFSVVTVPWDKPGVQYQLI